jgi:hypothetical protein
MKKHILILAFFFNSINLIAQSKKQITNWLYDLPIKNNAIRLKKAILKNDSFEEDPKSQSNSFKYSSSTYKGTILNPLLPKVGHLDSAKIHLAIGTLNSKDGYSGDMKWLRFEYFSSDTVFLKELFDTACIDLKYNAKQEKPTGFRTKKNDVIGEGVNYVYINDPDELRSISVLRVRYATGIQSFSIHYSGSND